jgi:cation:H+ antiporter
MIWIYFIIVAAIIIYAGSRLSSLAEELARLLNISSSTIGLLLVSIVTSLPELATSLGAAVKVGEPNLAAGNTMGSDLFNLMIIALCDLLFIKKGLLRQTSHRIAPFIHYLILISAIVLTFTLPNAAEIGDFHFNLGSVAVVALYMIIFILTHQAGGQHHAPALPDDRSLLGKTILKFSIAAGIIIISGIALAQIGDRIAEQTGLDQSFVGTLFLALATSLPELTVSISAMRISAYDLMIGNIIGSNMFNVFVIAVTDLAYRKAAFSFSENLNPALLFVAGCAVLMTLTATIAAKQKKTARWVAWESLLMIGLYLAGLFAIYKA